VSARKQSTNLCSHPYRETRFWLPLPRPEIRTVSRKTPAPRQQWQVREKTQLPPFHMSAVHTHNHSEVAPIAPACGPSVLVSSEQTRTSRLRLLGPSQLSGDIFAVLRSTTLLVSDTLSSPALVRLVSRSRGPASAADVDARFIQ
jgi:hypothetical protein